MLKLTKPPYGDTSVNADKTQQDITQLLRKYGVSQINWQIDYDMEQVQLDFIIEYTKSDQSGAVVIMSDRNSFSTEFNPKLTASNFAFIQ